MCPCPPPTILGVKCKRCSRQPHGPPSWRFCLVPADVNRSFTIRPIHWRSSCSTTLRWFPDGTPPPRPDPFELVLIHWASWHCLTPDLMTAVKEVQRRTSQSPQGTHPHCDCTLGYSADTSGVTTVSMSPALHSTAMMLPGMFTDICMYPSLDTTAALAKDGQPARILRWNALVPNTVDPPRAVFVSLPAVQQCLRVAVLKPSAVVPFHIQYSTGSVVVSRPSHRLPILSQAHNGHVCCVWSPRIEPPLA